MTENHTPSLPVKKVRKRLFLDAFTDEDSLKVVEHEEEKDSIPSTTGNREACKGQIWETGICTQKSVEARIFHE